MCGLKKPECQSKEQLSVSDQCLWFVCFCVYLPSALLLWNRKKFLPSGGSSRVFSLACQRTLKTVTVSSYKVYFICSKIQLPQELLQRDGLWKMESSTHWLLISLDCFDLGPKKHKDGQNICTSSQDKKRNEKSTYCLCHPSLFAVVGCFTVHILVFNAMLVK